MTCAYVNHKFINVAPYNSPGFLPDFIKRSTDCCSWLQDAIGLEIKGRIAKYAKNIVRYPQFRGGFGSELYYSLQSLNEMNDLIKISEQLQKQSSARFKESVKNAIHGPDFRGTVESSKTEKFRNYLFELKIAAAYEENNHAVDLSQVTDVVVINPLIAIECKRVTSADQIIRRAKEAIGQIEAIKECKPTTGFVYIDITSLFEQAATIYAFNETGFPYSIHPPSNDEDLIFEISHKILGDVKNLINKIENNLSELISSKVSCIVLNYDYVGFQASILHERAIVGDFSYVIFDENQIHNQSMELIKLTLGQKIST